MWCGAQYGGTVSSPVPGGSWPAMEWIEVTSSAAAVSRLGRIDGSRSASMVLPAPGGPSSDRLCPPAAQISAASRASAWPSTSARSFFRARAGAGAGSGDGSFTEAGWGCGPPRSQTMTSVRVLAPITPDAGDQDGLREVVRRDHDGVHRARRSQHRGQHAVDRPEPAVQAQFGQKQLSVQGRGPGTASSAARIAIEIARSKPEPSFGQAGG